MPIGYARASTAGQNLATQRVQDDGEYLAVLASLVERGEEADGDGISATFKEPVTIRRVELECFGDGFVEGLFGLTSAAGAVDTTSARASCAEGVLELDIPESSREGVTKVSFSSVASTEKGAWRVIVRERVAHRIALLGHRRYLRMRSARAYRMM